GRGRRRCRGACRCVGVRGGAAARLALARAQHRRVARRLPLTPRVRRARRRHDRHPRLRTRRALDVAAPRRHEPRPGDAPRSPPARCAARLRDRRRPRRHPHRAPRLAPAQPGEPPASRRGAARAAAARSRHDAALGRVGGSRPLPAGRGARRRPRGGCASVAVMTTELRIFTEPQQGASYDQLVAVAQAAEAHGFGAFFRSDHYLKMGDVSGMPGPSDAWITLAGIARETSTIRLGTLVTPITFRYPGPLAISVANVDAMSRGRVELGIGTGWYDTEHTAYAIPFPPLGERFAMLEDN